MFNCSVIVLLQVFIVLTTKLFYCEKIETSVSFYSLKIVE